MSSSKQDRSEKKRMEEAIARVREVVHSVSKNDIILALHNFDLDVNRTIQAFCDDGAQSALDSWERSGAGGNKKKNQKKKKAVSTPLATPTASSTTNGHAEYNNNNTVPATNGAVKPASAPARAAPSTTTSEVIASSIKPKAPLPSNGPAASAVVNFASVNSGQKDQVFAAEVARLKNHGSEIEKIEASFENELSIAEQNVRMAFKSVRQLLVDRESHLLAELKRCHDDGARILNERRVLACELNERAERMAAMSDREQAELREEMARFAAEGRWEAEMGHATRFLYDSTQLVKNAKNFGEVVGVKGFGTGPCTASAIHPAVGSAAATTLKNSTSHSSIVSSVGEDSGLGQISPVTSDDRKHVVEVSNGGIMMKSDALSADQLAELNKKLQESLKAQGIDASVLSGIGGLSSMPVRRRPAGGQRGGRGGSSSRPQRTAPVRVPELSILQS